MSAKEMFEELDYFVRCKADDNEKYIIYTHEKEVEKNIYIGAQIIIDKENKTVIKHFNDYMKIQPEIHYEELQAINKQFEELGE